MINWWLDFYYHLHIRSTNLKIRHISKKGLYGNVWKNFSPRRKLQTELRKQGDKNTFEGIAWNFSFCAIIYKISSKKHQQNVEIYTLYNTDVLDVL